MPVRHKRLITTKFRHIDPFADFLLCAVFLLHSFVCKNIESSRFHKNVPAETAGKCPGGTDGCCSVLFRSNIRTAPFPPPFSGSAKLHHPVHADPDFRPEAVQSFLPRPCISCQTSSGSKIIVSPSDSSNRSTPRSPDSRPSQDLPLYTVFHPKFHPDRYCAT